MSKLTDYISEQSKKKKKTPCEWLESMTALISKCSLATHVGKFTHPNSKVFLNDCSLENPIQYVTTKSTNILTDIVYSSASYMGAAKFLTLPLEDNETVLSHIQKQDKTVEQEITSFGFPFDKMTSAISDMERRSTIAPSFSDGNLRQVYFPVGDNDYHLLSILPSSSLLETLRIRITDMNRKAYESRKKDSESYGNDYSNIGSRISISFGGTKPQNISTLNANHGGHATLLESLPPSLEIRDIRIPKRNFFTEAIPYRESQELVSKLDKLFKLSHNNIAIRNAIERNLDRLIDISLAYAYRLREDIGWTNRPQYKKLPDHQKIWLDDFYIEKRNDGKWTERVSADFARWFIQYYRKRIKDPVILGDIQFRFIKERMKDILDEEVRLNG